MKARILLLFCLLGLLGCEGNVKLIYDPTGQYCISQFRYCGGPTIFTYGKVTTTRSLPKSYILAHNRWNDDWYGLIEWNGEEANFLYNYGYFELMNLDSSLLSAESIRQGIDFFPYFYDKIPNDYIKVSSIPEYNTQQ